MRNKIARCLRKWADLIDPQTKYPPRGGHYVETNDRGTGNRRSGRERLSYPPMPLPTPGPLAVDERYKQ